MGNLKAGILENKALRKLIIAVIMLLIGAFLLGAADAALYSTKVHRGISVSGVALGGKDRHSLEIEISKIASELEQKEISITHKEQKWTFSPEALDLKVDKLKTANAAFNAGKQGGISQVAKQRLSLWFKPQHIEPVITYNKEKLDSFIAKVANGVDKPAEDAAIKIVDGRAVVTSSRRGREVRKDLLKRQLLASFVSKETNAIKLPVEGAQPDITEDDLNEPIKLVKEMLKERVGLEYRDKKWEIPVEMLANWIEFKKVREADHWSFDVALHKDEVFSHLSELTKELTVEPKNAEFRIEGDKVVIDPSSDGSRVDLEKAYGGILEASKSETDKLVMLSTETIQPKLTTEDAGKMGIKEKVSSYTTYFNPYQASRVHNIVTLSRELDGNIVAPGEVFSFNGTIGPRTAAKGYKEAPAILNGELVPSLGGGVCQVATTLFNTIFFGGYEVVERHNHSFFISHYPAGRDATVSYGGPDLKFKNNTEQHVLIKVANAPGSITITFYSTNQGIKVDYTSNGPHSFKPAKIEYKDDPTMPKGTQKIFDKGVTGRDMSVFRTITKDGKVVKKDKFFSRYVPKKTVIRVGTKVDTPASPPPGGVAPAPGPVPQVPSQ